MENTRQILKNFIWCTLLLTFQTAIAAPESSAILTAPKDLKICRGFFAGKDFRVGHARELLKTLNCLEHPHLYSCSQQLISRKSFNKKRGFDLSIYLMGAAKLAAPVAEKNAEKAIYRSLRKNLIKYGSKTASWGGQIGAKGLGILLLPVSVILDGAQSPLNCGENGITVDSSCRPIKRADPSVMKKVDKIISLKMEDKRLSRRYPDPNGVLIPSKCDHLFRMLKQSRKDLENAFPKQTKVVCGPHRKTVSIRSKHGKVFYNTKLKVRHTSKGYQVTEYKSQPDGYFSYFSRARAKTKNNAVSLNDLSDIIGSERERTAFHRMKVIGPLAMAQCEEKWSRGEQNNSDRTSSLVGHR